MSTKVFLVSVRTTHITVATSPSRPWTRSPLVRCVKARGKPVSARKTWQVPAIQQCLEGSRLWRSVRFRCSCHILSASSSSSWAILAASWAWFANCSASSAASWAVSAACLAIVAASSACAFCACLVLRRSSSSC
eukprot:7899093-Heterocapsa_arctica.AAC.1